MPSHVWEFQVAAYPQPTKECPDTFDQMKVGSVSAIGSYEDRARRRILDKLHKEGYFVREMRLVNFVAKEGAELPPEFGGPQRKPEKFPKYKGE